MSTPENEHDDGAPSSDEQAQHLARIQGQAVPTDAATAPGAQQPADDADEMPEPGAMAQQAAAVIMTIVRPLASFAVPQLRDAPDELWAPIPEGLAAVLEEYGGDNLAIMKNPWVRLGMCCAPLAIYATQHAPQKTAPDALAAPASVVLEAPRPDAAAASQKTVTFGAPQA